MTPARSIHVRIVSPITTRGFRAEAAVRGLESPGLIVSATQIDRGPGSIECEYEQAMAAPDTVRAIIVAERDGVDAVVIDCMGDPGLRPARECVTIPVLGPGQTAMHVAAMLGHRFSIVTVLRRLRPSFENAAAVHGLAGRMASCRAIDIPVLELGTDMEATRAALVEEAAKAVELDGAEAVIFGCTGLLGCAGAVRDGLRARGIDIPVIDPIPTAVNMAAALARSGLSHSRLTFPAPPAKPMPGYDMPDLSLRAAE